MTGPFTLEGKRIWVAGHRGMVGSAIVRRLAREDCVLVDGPTGLDLTDQAATRAFINDARPDGVVLAAAKVGGIVANDSAPASFLYENLMIEANVIEAAAQAGTAKLLFLGSSCIYPRDAEQPIAEDALLTGPLEPTNEWYAIAKIAGIKLCQAYRKQGGHDFISAMPTNLYGPGDNYHPRNSHVLPALIRKAHEAKLAGADQMVVWGSGNPQREFLHVDDLADACVMLMRDYSAPEPVNIGWGKDISIGELARIVAQAVGFEGALRFDATKPDGTPRKCLDTRRLAAMGWQPRISLSDGIARTYADFMAGRGRNIDPRGESDG